MMKVGERRMGISADGKNIRMLATARKQLLYSCGASPGWRVIRPPLPVVLRPEDFTYFRLSFPPRPVFSV